MPNSAGFASLSRARAPALTAGRAFVVVAVVVAGCSSAPQTKPAGSSSPAASASAPSSSSAPPPSTAGATGSLYERLGGKPAIEAVIDRFIANVGADDRINHRFAYADFGKLRGHLVDQVCAATGGPCQYKGRPMKELHQGQRIDEAAWTALVEDLIAALDHFKVPAREKDELMGALGKMHDDIVEVAP